MKTLSGKNLLYFLVSTFIIMICCFPLFYKIMIHFYTEDLDELVEYRKNEFIEKSYNTFVESDINFWNIYNYDQKVLPYKETYRVNSIVQEEHYSPSDKGVVSYRTLYTPIKIGDKNYILMTRTAMIESDDLMEMILYQYGLLIFILIIFLSVLQWWISRKLWNPFYRNLDKIKQFNLERGSMPEFERTNTTEFVQLNENLEILITNNLKIYRQQKEFIENASHELQTPLAIFHSQLDMLLQDSNLTEEQVGIIQSLYDTTLRMTRLNKNLLLLAKIENKQFKEFEEFDFAEILCHQLALFHDRFENENLNLVVNIANSLLIKGNRILTESLINNLVVNAIRYTNVGENIEISLSHNLFTIKNSGENSLNDEIIFSRFNNTSKENNDSLGTGLGLSIVQQICKLQGWSITYKFIDQMHCFKITFSN